MPNTPTYPISLFPRDLEISDNEGFSPEKDIFKLKEFGDGMMSLCGKVQSPFVMVLDGPWGSGKTTFVKMWCGHMRNRGFPVIYFDAFANDYMDDAFLALAGEVVAYAEKIPSLKKTSKNFIDNSKKIAKQLLPLSAKLLIKLGCLNILANEDMENVKKAFEEVAKDGSQFVHDCLSERLEKRNEEKESLSAFKQSLENLAADLFVRSQSNGIIAEKTNTSLDHPLIFVVDELDRCRPDFAIKLLEAIKHILSVKNVVFVLVTNLDHLAKIVHAQYGLNEYAPSYLHKFYDIRLSLPMHKRAWKAGENIRTYLSELSKSKSTGFELEHSYLEECIDIITRVSVNNNYSIRDVLKVFQKAILILLNTEKSIIIPLDILTGLCTIQEHNNKLYCEVKKGAASYIDVSTFLSLDRPLPDLSLDSEAQHWKELLENSDVKHDSSHFVLECQRRYSIRSSKDILPILCRHIDRVSLP